MASNDGSFIVFWLGVTLYLQSPAFDRDIIATIVNLSKRTILRVGPRRRPLVIKQPALRHIVRRQPERRQTSMLFDRFMVSTRSERNVRSLAASLRAISVSGLPDAQVRRGGSFLVER